MRDEKQTFELWAPDRFIAYGGETREQLLKQNDQLLVAIEVTDALIARLLTAR